MKILYSFVIVVALSFIFIGCDNLRNDRVASKDLIDTQILEESVEEILVQPTKVGNADGSYQISIRFNESVKNQRLPDALVLCAIPDVPPLKKSDNSKLLYSSITRSSTIKELYIDSNLPNAKKSKALKMQSIGCKVSFTTPGEIDENCGETCSETSELGADTWFCVCFYDCELSIF